MNWLTKYFHERRENLLYLERVSSIQIPEKKDGQDKDICQNLHSFYVSAQYAAEAALNWKWKPNKKIRIAKHNIEVILTKAEEIEKTLLPLGQN
jgi:hypothetical protein